MSESRTYYPDEKISIWLIAAMFAVPFAIGYHITPIPSFYNEIAAFGFGLLALCPLLLSKNWQTFKIAPITMLWLLFIPLIILQCKIGLIPTRSQALMYTGYMIWAAMLAMLGSLHREQYTPQKIIRPLARMIVAVAWFNVFYVTLQLLQKYGLYEPTFMLAGSFGAISQGNHFASFNAIAIASLMYLQLDAPASSRPAAATFMARLHLVLGLLAFMTMLTISGSRSVWLYLAALAALSVWLAARQRHLKLRQFGGRAALVMIVLLPLFWLLQLAVSEFSAGKVLTATQRLAELTDQQAVGGIKMRLYMWQQSLEFFMQNPWLGHGLGNTRAATFATLDTVLPKGIPGSYEHPHNLFMWLLSETGLVGTLIVLLPLAFWLKACIRKPDSTEQWWLLGTLGILGIHGMLEYPFSYAYFLGLAAYLMGFSQPAVWNLAKYAASARFARYAVSVVLGFSMLISLHTFSAYHKLDHWVRMLMQKQFRAESMAQYYDTVSWLNQKSLLAAYSYPMFLLAIEYMPIDTAGKQAVNEQSLKILPMPKSAYLQPLYLLHQGKRDEALHAMELAVQSYPDDYKDRLKSVPPEMRAQYEVLYQAALISLQAAPTYIR